MPQFYDLDKLYTIHMIAEWYGVSDGAVVAWSKRYPDYPAPVRRFPGHFSLWDFDEVFAWHLDKWGR